MYYSLYDVLCQFLLSCSFAFNLFLYKAIYVFSKFSKLAIISLKIWDIKQRKGIVFGDFVVAQVWSLGRVVQSPIKLTQE